MSGAGAALALAALLGIAGPAQAGNECGPPEAGREVVCSPSTYDPAGGNIFYSHDENGRDETGGDFAIRLTGDLSIDYDRERPGDDVWVLPSDPEVDARGAVWISPGEFGEYAGDVSLYSSADVTSNARAIFAGHYGKSGALRMVVSGGDIKTTGEASHAIRGFRYLGSDGELDIVVRGATVDTAGDYARGIVGWHGGEGALALTARDLAIDTAGEDAYGIFGLHLGEGALALTARDLAIDTAGEHAYGIYGSHRGEGALALTAEDLSIDTAGDFAYGIVGLHGGEGALALTAQDLAIGTAGEHAYGIYGRHEGEGELALAAEDLSIETAGEHAHGVFAQHGGAGDVNLDVRGISVTTTGARASGIYGNHVDMEGDVAVRVLDGVITTAGAEAFGVRGFHAGPDALDIDLRDTSVATTGEGAHGIAIYRFGSGSARVAVDGGSVRAAGPGASGIRIGALGEDGSVALASPIGEDGYRGQSVSVNAPVTGGTGEDAAGVFLAGGGRVAIGPEGSVGAASGIAILASGGAAPRLRVDMDLDGRRAANVLHAGWIINDGGETTLAVNGVTLHEGATGATGAEAANGAWDVSVPASETIAGRSFTPDDFVETYAPRAAVYEALPGLLLRLDAGKPAGGRVTRPGSPVWARMAVGRGSYEPGRASVGAVYDFSRFSAEAGLDVALGENATGSLSLRHVQGSAEVASPYGGGEIEAEGVGVAAGLSWSGADGYYARGRLAFTNYEVDVSSRERGSLARGVEARGHTLGIEAGRRIAVGEAVALTPRVWAARSWLSGGGFTDAVGSRVSLTGRTRLTGGAGLSAETVQTFEDGTLALSASADIERALGGADTAAGVTGERLESEGSGTRVLVGLGGTWRKGQFSLGARLAAGGPGSGDTEYSGRVSLGWTF